MIGEGQGEKHRLGTTLTRGIREGFQEEAPTWPSLRDEHCWSLSHQGNSVCEGSEAS